MQGNESSDEKTVVTEDDTDEVLHYQIDLLTAMNAKLNESNVIYDKFNNISGNVCF